MLSARLLIRLRGVVIKSCQGREKLEPIAVHNDYRGLAGWILRCGLQAGEHGGRTFCLMTTSVRRTVVEGGKGCRVEVLRTMSAIGLAASVVLGGCTSSPETAESNKSARAVAKPDKVVAADTPARKAKTNVSTVASVARPKIDQVIGLDEAALRAAFGEPAAQEETAPSKLWIYRRRQCTMNVTLYPDVETRKFHALNYEVSGNDSSTRQQQCITQFSSQLAALAPPG